MKPVAIISCDATLDYLWCLPLVEKTWHLQGFDCDIYVPVEVFEWAKRNLNITYSFENLKLSSNNPALHSQLHRLYVCNEYDPDYYIIISDADMLILSDFIYYNQHKINVYGHDLTGRQHIPICYVGMSAREWQEVMGDEMNADILKLTNLQSKVTAWVADQDILTAKLIGYGYNNINFVDRGTDKRGLPKGRVDRYDGLKLPEDKLMDAHLPRRPWEWVDKIVEILAAAYPDENWDWVYNHNEQFKKEFNLS